MMKKMVFVLCIGLLAVMLQAATSSDETQKNSNTQKKEEKNAGDIKVTFIELGSVRCIPCKKMQPIME